MGDQQKLSPDEQIRSGREAFESGQDLSIGYERHDEQAVHLYLGFGLGPLVTLLPVRHCPWRHDFGLRYLHTDLPADVAERLTALLPGEGDPAALSSACFTWTRELLRERA